MALPLVKTNPTVNASLDVLKLVKAIAEAAEHDIAGSFYASGALSESAAIKNLKKIQGRMETLKAIVNNTN